VSQPRAALLQPGSRRRRPPRNGAARSSSLFLLLAAASLVPLGYKVLGADLWWRHVDLHAALWLTWLVFTPVAVAVCGRRFWRWLAAEPARFWPPWWCKPTLLVTPIITGLAVVVAFADQTVLALEIAAGDHAPMAIERRGNRLYVSGDINFGSAARVETALAAARDVTEVVLDSPGGFIVEARRIADMIETRRLDTRIDRECHSACVDLFAAGAARTMRADAIVGLHSAWSTDATLETLDAIAFVNAAFMRRLHAVGVERRFLEVGMATPGSRMWINTARQAHVAGLATRVVE
jgi:hypothetical protein